MSKHRVVALRYAESLIELCDEDASLLSSVSADFSDFISMLEESSDLREFVNSPLISVDESLRAFEGIFSVWKDVSKVFRDFILLCAENKRLNIIREIYKEFLKKKETLEGVTELVVTSAIELGDEQVEKIKSIASRYSDKRFKVVKKIDEGVLGGFVVEFDSYRIDASTKARLLKLENIFKGVA